MKTRVIVAAVIENSIGEILFGKQKNGRGVYLDCWHIPGGGIEKDERIYDALKREIREETGLEISVIEPVSFSDDVTIRKKDGKSEKIHLIFLDFKCKAVSDTPNPADDIAELKWISINKIRDLKLSPPSQHLFKKLNWI